mmetsp:Transcript_12257/g.19922  ORF Transcript_12257/g.19922 Transcript_12257/m.19922 type:complete len:117 (-) Transcript_12257:65-415(-)|eukprot:CAMPEP_0203744244 /NCGR_PEP_ID=MMETSP0098-20131031/384_1 /ASSEMBLY_ACC=CAM_ASM_000208 /TAXON_ID=96639 /ORGANISM=" , Strain NY0313808BC1" /LENGTH=116 /DNA_ID=CAMNT_0050631711 /DNA_START=155 /DNA_END=505 /DNA_ORIENTATION=-
MSSKDKQVELENGVEVNDGGSMKRHLTMKYDVKQLRLFTNFETWAQEALEELIPDDSTRPIVEATSLAKITEAQRIETLQKLLGPHIGDEKARDYFIEQYVEKYRALPPDLLNKYV